MEKTILKLIGPKSLTTEQGAPLKRWRGLLASGRDTLSAKSQDAAEPRRQLNSAIERQQQLDGIGGKAAFDSQAAAELTGLRLQVSLLTPVVERQEKHLNAEVGNAGRQIGLVRREIKELLRFPLYEQLVQIVRGIVAPLYAAQALDAVAKNLASDNELSWQANGYLNRVAPRPSSVSLAVAWLSLTIAELDALLEGGQELVRFDHKSGRVEFIDQTLADRLNIDLPQLVADSEANA